MIAIILAGGLGKRMNSDLPKPAHKIDGKSLLQHVIDKLSSFDRLFIVYGQKCLDEYIIPQNNIVWVHQDPQLGTGHAVQVAFREIEKHYDGTSNMKILICNGDAPFIRKETIRKITSAKFDASLLLCDVANPNGYGRIILENQRFNRIVEEKDCNDNQRNITLINAGLYCLTYDMLKKYIHQLNNQNAQNEYYLTDLFEILVKNDEYISSIIITDEMEIYNINTPEQLESANNFYIKIK
jgi:UDP-N-acetylglucosamine diphosphorylase/glucosamine-1-phosphate N-acetyltransferase